MIATEPEVKGALLYQQCIARRHNVKGAAADGIGRPVQGCVRSKESPDAQIDVIPLPVVLLPRIPAEEEHLNGCACVHLRTQKTDVDAGIGCRPDSIPSALQELLHGEQLLRIGKIAGRVTYPKQDQDYSGYGSHNFLFGLRFVSGLPPCAGERLPRVSSHAASGKR